MSARVQNALLCIIAGILLAIVLGAWMSYGYSVTDPCLSRYAPPPPSCPFPTPERTR